MERITSKEKEKLNELIAEKLGFKKYTIKNLLSTTTYCKNKAWIFPEDWYGEQGGVPAYNLPDFVEMIYQAKKIKNMFDLGLPSQFFKSQIKTEA